MPKIEKAKHISNCLEMAILFEVTANKPGNVNPTSGFDGTRIEHFLSSAVAASSTFEKAAKRGMEVSEGKISISETHIGQLIRDCVSDIDAWQKGGNTLLGTVMLFIPIAVAAGIVPWNEKGEFSLTEIRKNIKLAVESTTVQDAVDLYDAIAIAKPSGLNEAPDLSVSSAESKTRLVKENVTLFQVFKIAEGYDDICYEWVNNYPISFDTGYPDILEKLKTKKSNLNNAILHTFLKILSERPDTFISRKVGLEKAKEVTAEATKILRIGGIQTKKGQDAIDLFDKHLREAGNKCNPGTTADITSATIALLTLTGYRP